MPIAVTAISNANNNLSQNKPGCNCPICTQNRNRLISPSIIPVDPTTITTTISPINTFPNNNNMPIVNTSVDYDNNNSNLPIPGCNCPACQIHTRAYVHHLCSVHEMLSWILLSIHNLSYILCFLKK